MKEKVWKERHIYFKMDTKAVIAPNETHDGVVLRVAETIENKGEFRVYLSYKEAEELAKQLVSFVEENNAYSDVIVGQNEQLPCPHCGYRSVFLQNK